METRSRHSSYSAGTEDEEGTEEEEPSPFRGRSRSAPPNLWAARRYGRELRRMSDEFHGSFKVSSGRGAQGTVVPEHAGTYTPGAPPTGLSHSSPTACRDLRSRDSSPQPVLSRVPGHFGICNPDPAPEGQCSCVPQIL